MTQKHSPTPMPPPYTSEGRAIRACDGRKSVTIARLVPGVLAIEHEEPTAQFIVRAVNAHDALVSALEAIVNAHDAMVDDFEEQVVEIARAAIRAARGEV